MIDYDKACEPTDYIREFYGHCATKPEQAAPLASGWTEQPPSTGPVLIPSPLKSLIKGIEGANPLSGGYDDLVTEPFQRCRDPKRSRRRQILDELALL